MSYWAAKAYLPHSTRAPERYSGDAVDMAVLIQQELRQGLLLREAGAQARAYLAAERARQPDLHALDAAALATIASQVAQADEAVRQVLAVVAPLAPPMETAP